MATSRDETLLWHCRGDSPWRRGAQHRQGEDLGQVEHLGQQGPERQQGADPEQGGRRSQKGHVNPISLQQQEQQPEAVSLQQSTRRQGELSFGERKQKA